MSEILSENQADKIVIKNLLKEINRLKGLNKMGKILLDTNGDLYLAEVYKPFAEIDAENLVARAKAELAEYENALALSDKLQTQATPELAPEVNEAKAAEPAPTLEQPQAPVEQPVTPVEAPSQAPAPVAEAQPEQTVQPAHQPIVIQ